MKEEIIGETMKNYPEKSLSYATVAVDVALFCLKDSKLHVLLIELNRPEFPSMWALPGGLVAHGENLDQAAQRHLRDRGGEGEVYIEQLASFGEPDRDPTGWVVSVAYLALTTDTSFKPKTSSRYKSVSWVDVNKVPSLAYDHKEILKAAVSRLKSKLMYSNIIYALMAPEFTLTDLQEAYEIILGKTLDKRNFRKKMLSLNLLKEIDGKRVVGAHRPAQMYSFNTHKLQITQTL